MSPNRAGTGLHPLVQSIVSLRVRWKMGALFAIAGIISIALAGGEINQAPAAGFSITSFDGNLAKQAEPVAKDAGTYPFEMTTTFTVATEENGNGKALPTADLKDVRVAFPPGLIGIPPNIATRCDLTELISMLCPISSQIGVVRARTVNGLLTAPLYNMIAPPGSPGQIAFALESAVIVLAPGLRDGSDLGIIVTSRNTSQAIPVYGVTVTVWGVPAAPEHDSQRCAILDKSESAMCSGEDELNRPHAAGVPVTPFLRLPTSCTAPGEGLRFDIEADSWQNPGVFQHATFFTHQPGEPDNQVGTTGCDVVPFEPSFVLQPTSHEADSPTGLVASISVPRDDNPDGIASSDLKKAVVTLPQGMTVNPSSADGLGSCSQAALGRETASSDPGQGCPLNAKIGTIEVRTPLLEEPLQGSVYLARQGENEFGSLLAIYVVVKSAERGVIVKLRGHVVPGPDGQLTTTFDGAPQLPFESFRLSLKGGPRAPLINPPTCGTKFAEAELYPWARPQEAASRPASFQIASGPSGSACPTDPAAFNPTLEAGVLNPLAGAKTPFVLRLSREDGSQRFASLKASLPPGLLASLKGVSYCPEGALGAVSSALGSGAAQLASPICPAQSQVGTVTVGAGAGPSPFFVQTGRAYLAGPYKGAPLSLAVLSPAIAGPFDLGSVLVRTALQVNPESAQVTAISDPLPTILHGIPLDLRDVRVNLDRPNFTLNPTSCDPMVINATVGGNEGATANRSSHFQVAECQRLAFKPKLGLRLEGSTRRGGHPALRATLSMPKGRGANIAKAQVTLPHSEFLAQSHIRTICTRVRFAADNCPKGSIYGHARAITPLLDQPLEGPVYLRSSSNPLPDLVAHLGGQIEVDLVGRIDSTKGGGIRTTFAQVPDAPVSKFTLTMQGAKKGLLENSRDLCSSTNRASVLFDAHNGKVSDLAPVVRAAGCGAARHGAGRR